MDARADGASAMTPDSPLLATMVPAFVADVIRRDLVREMIEIAAAGGDPGEIV